MDNCATISEDAETDIILKKMLSIYVWEEKNISVSQIAVDADLPKEALFEARIVLISFFCTRMLQLKK